MQLTDVTVAKVVDQRGEILKTAECSQLTGRLAARVA